MFESLRTQGTFDRSQRSQTVLAALSLSSRLAGEHEIQSASGEQVASLCQSILCFPRGPALLDTKNTGLGLGACLVLRIYFSFSP